MLDDIVNREIVLLTDEQREAFGQLVTAYMVGYLDDVQGRDRSDYVYDFYIGAVPGRPGIFGGRPLSSKAVFSEKLILPREAELRETVEYFARYCIFAKHFAEMACTGTPDIGIEIHNAFKSYSIALNGQLLPLTEIALSKKLYLILRRYE